MFSPLNLIRKLYEPDYRYDINPRLLLSNYDVPSSLLLSGCGYDVPACPSVTPQEMKRLVRLYLNESQGGAVDRDRQLRSCSNEDADKFQLRLNVKHFSPDEIDVKIVDGFIIVHCKHQEQVDEHGLISREFTRRYEVPDDVDSKTVKSSLSKDGILTISAPRKVEPPPKNVRIVPITVQKPAGFEEAEKQQSPMQEQPQNEPMQE